MIFLNKKRKKGGFTLVEMLVAVAIFSIVMSMGIGAVLSMLQNTKTARAMSVVMNDLNITLDSMTREMRFGIDYYCSGDGNDGGILGGGRYDTNECSDGGTHIFFTDPENDERIGFGFDNNEGIVRVVDDGEQTKISAEEVIIEDLRFIVSKGGDSLNPRSSVLIIIEGSLRNEPSSKFNLQTTVGQRGIF